jgi:hypothetical protein
MLNHFYTLVCAGAAPQRKRPAETDGKRRPAAPLSLEKLEDRLVPATQGEIQLHASQVMTAISTSTEQAFEENYKVFSADAHVIELAELTSAFLHSEQNALTQNLLVPLQSQLTQTVVLQKLGYVTQEVNTLETWFVGASSTDAPDTILTQLTALAQSFQAVEQTASKAIAQELSTGVTIPNNSSAFTYVAPQFLNPAGGGVATPSTTPSIIAPPQIISLMNNDEINQLVGATSQLASSTSVSLTSSANPSALGQAVTVTATVNPITGAAGVPTGTVTFIIDGNTQPAVTLANGQASFTVPAASLPLGTHNITAVYSGDKTFQASTTLLSQRVFQAATVTVTPPATPLPAATPPLLTATVVAAKAGTGTPTGPVNFFANGNFVGQGILNPGTNQATFQIAPNQLPAGNYNITAFYAGDNIFAQQASTFSQPLTLTAASITTVAAPTSPSPAANPPLLTATVLPAVAGTGPPTGTVNFFANGNNIGQGKIDPTTNKATFQPAANALAAGNYNITASYSGDNLFAPSTTATGQPLVIT